MAETAQHYDGRQARDIAPNCPEHDTSMSWDGDREAYYCPEPCGWEWQL